MEPLYTKKVGAYVRKSQFWSSLYVPGRQASYPFSSLNLFKDYIIIKILGRDFSIKYEDIDFIEKKLFQIKINHHAKDIDKHVGITGLCFGTKIFKEMKEVIQKNNLHIPIKN